MTAASEFQNNMLKYLYMVLQPAIMQRLVIGLRRQAKSVAPLKLEKLSVEVLPFKENVGVDRRRLRRQLMMIYGFKEANMADPMLYKKVQGLLEFEVTDWGNDPVADVFKNNNIRSFTKKFFPIGRVKIYRYKFVLLIKPRSAIQELNKMIETVLKKQSIDGIGEWDFKSGNIDWVQTKQRLIKDINQEYDVSRTRNFLNNFVKDEKYIDSELQRLINKFSVQPQSFKIYKSLWSGWVKDIRKFYDYLVKALHVK